jgi:hypothetical protein
MANALVTATVPLAWLRLIASLRSSVSNPFVNEASGVSSSRACCGLPGPANPPFLERTQHFRIVAESYAGIFPNFWLPSGMVVQCSLLSQ